MDSHRKGDLTEAIVIAELKRRSIPVSLPFGDNERYDLVVETPDGALLRVQVKTGWQSEGKIEFHTRSQHTNSKGNTYKPYDDDIDYFLVYCHELETLHFIHEDEFEGSISLRIEEPEMENRRINWATDFEFDKRWPPDDTLDTQAISERESITRVIDILEAEDVRVAKPVNGSEKRLILEQPNQDLSRVVVKSGWTEDGRIRYAHERISDTVDYLAIYVPHTDKLYFVPRSRFNSSIILRVDEPKKQDSRINWAEEYVFPENVPWD